MPLWRAIRNGAVGARCARFATAARGAPPRDPRRHGASIGVAAHRGHTVSQNRPEPLSRATVPVDEAVAIVPLVGESATLADEPSSDAGTWKRRRRVGIDGAPSLSRFHAKRPYAAPRKMTIAFASRW